MKISPEARNYANALYYERHRQNLNKRDYGLMFIRAEAQRNPANIIQDIVMHLAESHKQILLARMETFVAAYRKEGLTLDAEDYNEILDYLRTMTTSGLNGMLDMRIPEFRNPDSDEIIYFIPQHLMNHLQMALDDVRIKLDIAMHELILDAKRQTNNAGFNITIHGDNRGPIQQGGQSNIQNISRGMKDETK